MLSTVKKSGNSTYIIIPKPMLMELGATAGDHVQLIVDAGRIIIERVITSPRQGWAADAKRLAANGDDVSGWSEFGNKDDDALTW